LESPFIRGVCNRISLHWTDRQRGARDANNFNFSAISYRCVFRATRDPPHVVDQQTSDTGFRHIGQHSLAAKKIVSLLIGTVISPATAPMACIKPK